MQAQIYHNPRCSKSRETLNLLRARGIEPQIILYLETAPDSDMLLQLLSKLGFEDVRQLLRTKEPLYRELGLGDQNLTQAELRNIVSNNPSLIERPIVVWGDRAKLGRPPEQVLALFDS